MARMCAESEGFLMSTMPERRAADVDNDGGPAVPRVPTAESTEVAPRQCGRCRQWFDGDPTLHPRAIASWWLCPACHTTLLGDGRHRSAAAATTAAPGGTLDAH
jgi:hypothetical protein